jgi:putative transposase
MEANEMGINEKLLDELMKDYKNPEDLLGETGLLKQLTKALLEKALEGEMTHHLGYPKWSPAGKNSGNSRNGKHDKTIKGDFGEMEIEVPRDRNSEFDPTIIGKHQTHFDGFDDKIISMYARGMSTRDIQGHLKEIYQIEVSPDFISTVTDSVMDAVKEWQNRPLDEIYPILYLDALQVKVKDQGQVINKAVYLVVGINMEGKKEVLGFWIEKTEGSKFWLQVVTELKNRGVKDIFIACVDGLKGFPDAIRSVYPKTEIQLCIVHMVRNSLKFVSYKDRKKIAGDLKEIYRAATVEVAEKALETFSATWDSKYPSISQSWKNNWANIIPFFAYPPEIRKVVYTTNAIESLNMTLRKILKTRASFPNDDALRKLLFLGLQNASKKWTMPIRDWGSAINQFLILYGDRVAL